VFDTARSDEEGTLVKIYLMIRRFDGAVGAVAAAWLTPTTASPMLNAADRAEIPVLAVMVYVAVPEPLPPPVIVAHA